MTAQEAQTILEIESPFTTVELKSAHKNALVTWFPAQFMSDRAKLAHALEQTERIHEAYDMLLSQCEKEEKKANPWLEEAMRHAYGQTPAAVSTISTARVADPALGAPEEMAPAPLPPPEPQNPPSLEPPSREDLPPAPASSSSTPLPAFPEIAVAVPSVPAPEPESTASALPPKTPVANPFLHDVGPLKTPAMIAAEGPKVELRGKAAPPAPAAEPATGAAFDTPLPAPASFPQGGAVPAPVVPRMDPAIKVRPPKVVISPRLRGAVTPSPSPMPVVTMPIPLPPIGVPSPVPAPLATPIVPPEPPAPVVTPAPEVEATPEATPVPIPTPVPDPISPSPSTPPVAEKAVEEVSPPEASVRALAPAPAPELAPSTTASAALAEEAAAAQQAAHHGPAAKAAVPVPDTGAKADPDASTDELAGDHALVPALGDRYHPAEKEVSPNTDSSRHLPTRPVAPSGPVGIDDGDGAASSAIGQFSASPGASGAGRASLSAKQKFLRFVLGVACVTGVGYGLYWLSQSEVGRDPWGSKPGSGGPGERVQQKAFESLMHAAENGNADVQLKVGRAYLQGKGVAQNPEEAVKWFRKAAEQGNVDAQYAVGDAYKSGTGVPQDNAEALKWYRKAEASREEQRDTGGKGKEKEEDLRLK